MKKLLSVAVFVLVSAFIFNYSAIAANDGPGSAPNSGDGVSDASGMGGDFGNPDGAAPNSGDGDSDGSGMVGDFGNPDSHGPAPSSGDGVPDGSGMDGHYGGDGDSGK